MSSIMISLSRRLSSKFIKPSFSSCISSPQDPKFESFANYSSSIFTQQTQPLNPNFHFSRNASILQKSKSFPQTLDLKLKEITLTNTLLNNQRFREFSTSGSSSKPDISVLANENRDEWEKSLKHQYDAIKLIASATFGLVGFGNSICYTIIYVTPELKPPLGYACAILDVCGLCLISYTALHARSLAKNHKMVEDIVKRLEEEGCEEGLADILRKTKATNLHLVECRKVFLTYLGRATASTLPLLSVILLVYIYINV